MTKDKQMIRIKDIIQVLEKWAPKSLAADYDNVGLLVGDKNVEITNVLVSLDCTEAIVDEAIARDCNLIVSHHPIVFKGLKRFTSSTYVERTVIKAIKNDIALYAIHTNLDSVDTGVNRKIADLIGLENKQILMPYSGGLQKLTFFVPEANVVEVRDAVHAVGGGKIGNYSKCSFNVLGTGIYKPEEGAKPYLGEIAKIHEESELRVELIYPDYLRSNILHALKVTHPYEEVAYYEHGLLNEDSYNGSGMIGELTDEMDPTAFLNLLKERMGLSHIKHTSMEGVKIRKVALCGGSGGFLLRKARAKGADVFISADFKYHDYFDARDTVPIVDIGHYESERFTVDLIGDYLREKFSTFATHLTEVNTNPIQYF